MSTVVNGHVVGHWSITCPASPDKLAQMDRDGNCTACGQHLPLSQGAPK